MSHSCAHGRDLKNQCVECDRRGCIAQAVTELEQSLTDTVPTLSHAQASQRRTLEILRRLLSTDGG